MKTPIRFDVIGHPRPQGSKRAFVNPQTGRAIMTESSGAAHREWRQDVKAAAFNAAAEVLCFTPYDSAVCVDTIYRFARPKGHYRTGRNAHLLRDDAPTHPITRSVGDLEKLARTTHDALTTAGIWTDDSIVAELHITKVYATADQLPGALICIAPLNPVPASALILPPPDAGTASQSPVVASTALGTADATTDQGVLL